MSPEKFCVNCGAPLEDGQRFCPSCGQPTDSLPEDEADVTPIDEAWEAESEGPRDDEPAPPPPPPPSGGLRPVASSSAHDDGPTAAGSSGQRAEPTRPTPSQPASPPPPPSRPAAPPATTGGGGSVPPLGGQGGPVGSTPSRPARPARAAQPVRTAPPSTGADEPKKNKTLYWVLGCGCLAVLLAVVIVVVIALRGAGQLGSQIESAVGEAGIPIERAVTVEARPEGTLVVATEEAEATSAPTEPTSEPAGATSGLSAIVGDLLYEDDFGDADSGWDVFAGDDQTVGYEGGRYVIVINATDWMSWGNAYQWFGDGIVVEVDATKIGGPDDNGYGIVFGYQDVENFYRYEIASDGYYRLGKYVANEWIELIPWMETDQVNPGEDTNSIAVEMGGGTIWLYANGTLLDSAVDRTFSDGDIGLVASSFGQPGVQIAFDDLRVYALQSDGGASASSGGEVIAIGALWGSWYGVDSDGIAGYFQFADDGGFIIADTEMGYWGDAEYRLEDQDGERWIMVYDASNDEWQPIASVEFIGSDTILLTNPWDDTIEMERISDDELDDVLAELEYQPLFGD